MSAPSTSGLSVVLLKKAKILTVNISYITSQLYYCYELSKLNKIALLCFFCTPWLPILGINTKLATVKKFFNICCVQTEWKKFL